MFPRLTRGSVVHGVTALRVLAALTLVFVFFGEVCMAGPAGFGLQAPAARTATTAKSDAKMPAESHGAPAGYRIGAGDVLQINVWKEREASVEAAVVRPDGKISLPLVKEM